MTTTRRTHDAFYLDENRYKQPKRMFLDVIDQIRRTIGNERGRVIADFGCAAGEFPYALRSAFPDAAIEGYDLLPELIEKARREVANVDFHVGSITDPGLCAERHVDYALCVGVLSIFDAFEPIIDNLLRWTKPGGRVILQGLFNNHPIDVNTKYSLSDDYGTNVLEAGWNIFSKASVSRWLSRRTDIEGFEFTDFQLDVDLERQDDPARSWTFKDADGKRILTNGLCIMQPHAFLNIHKKG